MSPLGLGLVGFGRLARAYYLPALRVLRGVRLAAVADPSRESREAAAACGLPVRVLASVEELVACGAVDAVLVASPPSSHRAAWHTAAAAGRPVFVEKPLLLASELPLLEPEPNARVMVDFNRRFWAPFRRAREIIRSGVLGTPLAVEFQLHLDVLSWSTITRHRLSPAEGGVAHDLGSHAIDFTSWLLGERPEHVAAKAATARWPEDRLDLTMTFPSGSIAHADLAYGERTRERLEVRGPHGRLWQDEPNHAVHVRRRREAGRVAAARLLDLAVLGYRGVRRSRSFGRASIHSALSAFVEATRAGRPYDPGLREGVWNARCVAAALRSAAAGGVAVRP